MLSKTNQRKIERAIKKYKLVQKSPYSDSYYSAGDIGWYSKPEGSYRLSDHWNFYSYCELHCKTTCGTTNGWYVGVYHKGVYTLLEKILNDEDIAREERMVKKEREKEWKRREAIEAEKKRIFKENAKSRVKTLSINGQEIARNTNEGVLIEEAYKKANQLRKAHIQAIENNIDFADEKLYLGGKKGYRYANIVVRSLNGRIYKKYKIRLQMNGKAVIV